jgi:peptidoglycan/xylan/chitin deacetylase (PgdA/CDA1 family)
MRRLIVQADLRNRNLLPPRSDIGHEHLEKRDPVNVEERATNTNIDGQCGPGYGSCAAGYCCSGAGWCGQGIDYCAAPNCLFYYGPGCDQNVTPPGPSTSDIARPQLNADLEYGGDGIYDCINPGDVALTYDDGPWLYTGDLLDIYAAHGAVATFFVTGINNGKGEIDNTYFPYAGYLQRMVAEGHQVASHTWSHNNLDTEFATSADRKLNMYKNEMAIRNVIGKFPTYMRPPYSACSGGKNSTGGTDSCESDLKALGYNIVYFDLDTEDYLLDSKVLIQQAKNDFSGNLSTTTPDTGSWLVISHDIHYQTVYNLTAFMLDTLTTAGYKAVTVGECLGDPAANWYRTDARGATFSAANSTTGTTGSTTTAAPVTSATAISTSAECGGSTGLTCAGSTFGNCCSTGGWCGSTDAYCGTGCQSNFGLCGSGVGSSILSTTTTTAASTVASVASSVVSSPAPAASLAVSTSAQCGASVGLTCAGSTFGNCCSSGGWW